MLRLSREGILRIELASRRSVAIAVVAGMLVLPMSGRAATTPTGLEGALGTSASTFYVCVTSTVLTAAGVVAGIIYGFYTTTSKKEPKDEEVKKAELDKVGKAMKAFLVANQLQLRQDLAVGAGPLVRDLAAAAEIRQEQLPRFGAVLRANRAELLGLASTDGLTSERALRFLTRIGDLTKADAELSSSYQGWLQRQQQLGG